MSPSGRLLRQAVPGPIKRALKATWSSWRWWRARSGLRALRPGIDPSPELCSRLIRAWDNQGFVAGVEALALLASSVRAGRYDILECGCGLSTIVLGALTRGTGRKLYSLEHLEEWANPVRRELAALHFDHVEVIVAPLRDFGSYWWYDLEATRLPRNIDLVFCDGPPGTTPNGRVGLLDRVGDRLAPHAQIVLDDAARDGEQEAIRIWTQRFGVLSRSGAGDSVALLELP